MSNVPPGAAFFAAVRPLFGGSLSQQQVDGINHIVSVWAVRGDGDDAKLAYLLATAFHETAQTMQPVRETLASNDAQAKARLTKAFNAGRLPWVKKDYWSSGFFGRGYVQLTHADNYRKAGEKIGADLVANPSLALDPDIAAVILIRGCMEGWFTGKSLGDYINRDTVDYVNARRVVNGTDRAQLIADHAETFEKAIAADRKAVQPAPDRPGTQVPPDTPKPPTGQPAGLLAAIIALILAAGAAILKALGAI